MMTDDRARVEGEAIDPERYCVGLIVEEFCEVGKWLGKMLRFGMDTPGRLNGSGAVSGETPRTLIPAELGDLLAAIDFARAHSLVDFVEVDAARSAKLAKLLNPEEKDNLGRPLAPQPAALAHTPPEPRARGERDRQWHALCVELLSIIDGQGGGMLDALRGAAERARAVLANLAPPSEAEPSARAEGDIGLIKTLLMARSAIIENDQDRNTVIDAIDVGIQAQVQKPCEICSTCGVPLPFGYMACDETMGHYCERCWPDVDCEELHGEGCATGVFIEPDLKPPAAVLAEREACAKAAENAPFPADYIWSDSNIAKFRFGAEEAAAAIRARSISEEG